MLRLNDVTIARGTRILYEHATAVADAADRVGKTAAAKALFLPPFSGNSRRKQARLTRRP